MSVDIRITVTDAEYRSLLAIASRHDVQVHHLIEKQVRVGLRIPVPPSPATRKRKAKGWSAVTDEEKTRMLSLRAEGLTTTEIARELKRPVSTVYLYLKQSS